MVIPCPIRSADALDFDALPQWGPWVAEIVAGMASQTLVDELARTEPEYIEDARDWVVERTGREQVLENIAHGLRARFVRLYHGTRLATAEVARVREHGLRPLSLIERRDALVEALGAHPRWSEVEGRVDEALAHFGPNGRR